MVTSCDGEFSVADKPPLIKLPIADNGLLNLLDISLVFDSTLGTVLFGSTKVECRDEERSRRG